MGYTLADLQAIQSAIATGALKVRYADGREVTYRSLKEMEKIEATIRAAVGLGSAPRTLVAEFRR